jgi:hypothetical protein
LINSKDEWAFTFELISRGWRGFHHNLRNVDCRDSSGFVDNFDWGLIPIFLLVFDNFHGMITSRNNTFPIPFLELPKTHITPGLLFVVMLVWVCRRKPCRAQIAKMGTALEANHVIATMSLLTRSRTGGTGCGMSLQVLERFLVLLGEFSGVRFRCTGFEFTVPALVTSAAECEGAVLAYCK